jgi:tripartite-type tricarboxylate transporter receptor subunit TctC
MKKILILAVLAWLGAGSEWANADTYPQQNITLVVPYPPGSAADIEARQIGVKVAADWGKQVIVENRPGAGGSVGAEYVAHAKPDGYTLLLCTNSPLTTNPYLYKSLHYDAVKDFEPVILLSKNGMVVVANTSQKFKTFKELLDQAKANPGEIMVGTSGNGTTTHLALAQINKSAGVNLSAVPYNGGTPSLTAAVSGEVQATIADISAALPLLRDGRLIALASTASSRSQVAPTVPTLQESGLPGIVIEPWIGLLAPQGTPVDIVNRLNQEMNSFLATPQARKQLDNFGMTPVGGSPEALRQTLAHDIPLWRERVRAAGVHLD